VDLDNDGDLDLFLAVERNTPNRYLRNDSGTFVDASVTPLNDSGLSLGLAVGDYDSDGYQDVFVANYFYSTNQLLHNEARDNHWLEVNLQGTVSNRAGIGARVRVVAGGVSTIREVTAGSTPTASLAASFGLGSATSVDSLIVHWPSGIRQIVSPPPAVDNKVAVVEVEPVGIEAPQLPGPYRLHPASPNPFNPGTSLRFELPRAGDVRLTIYEIAGRRVRELHRGLLLAGTHEVTWHGRDGRGARVASVVYRYRLEAGSFVQTKRMVRLKQTPESAKCRQPRPSEKPGGAAR
jgi:hypothetical protein